MQPCRVLETENGAITPGLVETVSSLGLVEVGLESTTADTDAHGRDSHEGLRPDFLVAPAINPSSSLLPVTRAEGITHAVTLPGGGMLSGTAAYIQLDGDRVSEVVLEPAVADVVRMGARDKGSRAETLNRLQNLFVEAREFRKREGAWMKGSGPDPRWAPHVLRSLYPALDGERPLMLFADRASDLEWIAEWVSVNRFRAVVVGAAEGWRVADLLAKAGIAVIVDPLLFRGRSFDQLQARPDNAALLVEAGVPVILSSFSTHNARSLRQVAGNAIREGMAPLDAMRALTKTPRTVFEQKTSKHLVIWDGDPFELSTRAVEVWIDGKRVSLSSRQTKLRDRYIERLGLQAN